MNSKHKTLHKLALIAVPFVFVVIALGAFTRLADAGLGCPDWPTCYGHVLWPDEVHEIDQANETYDETPVETDKTWPEQVHRLFAGSLGLISLLVFFMAVRLNDNKKQNVVLSSVVVVLLASLVAKIVAKQNIEITAEAMHDIYDPIIGGIVLVCVLAIGFMGLRKGPSETPVKLPAFIVAFVILQGLFGMWTVTLKVWPQVVTMHLLGGFTMAALFWLLALRLKKAHWQLGAAALDKLNKMKPLITAGFIIVVIQIALGGWTTSNYAAVACPDLPTCQGQWLPDTDFAQAFDLTQDIGPNYLGGQMDNTARVTIHLTHRIGAIVTLVMLLFIAIKLIKQVAAPAAKRMGAVILFVLTLQILLGLGNILFNFPLAVAVAHNAGGAVLLLCMVTLLYKAYTARLSGNDND